MDKIPDPHIFCQLQKGDKTAFNKLFNSYYTSLCFFACKYLGDMDISRSVVQQFFVDLWDKRKSIKIKYSIKSYFYRSIRNRCIDYLRKRKPISPISESIKNVQTVPFRDLVAEAELNSKINQSINNLPDRCREIFLLCRIEGLKYSEIATRLHISIKTVEMQMSIALKRLRNSLTDYQIISLLIYLLSKKN